MSAEDRPFAERNNHLVQFTIYERPRDYPEGFVVRRWLICPNIATPDVATTHKTLESARESIPRGLVCISRSPEDDPCIVEVWT